MCGTALGQNGVSSNDGQLWFYLSFADPQRPPGEQFLGAAYVRVPTWDPESMRQARFWMKFNREAAGLDPPTKEEIMLATVISRTHVLGLNPGGEVKSVGPIPDNAIQEIVPVEQQERLLSRSELGESSQWAD